MDIAHRRLANQDLTTPRLTHPEAVVAWMGAVQAQDYAAAKWALGLRLVDATDEVVEQAFTDGSIVRTHVLRPTWHFVAPADIRWMLALTGPRVRALSAPYFRKLGLDQRVLARCNAAIERALRGGKQCTREQLRDVLQEAGIQADGELRLPYILTHGELDALICSGPRQGKQFTYMLLEERVPPAPAMERDESVRELARRFFLSHGPATPQDFAKWSGLTVADARLGIELAGHDLRKETWGRQSFWCSAAESAAPPEPRTRPRPTAYLLPNYDEYTIGYRDHDAVFDAPNMSQLIFAHTIILDGQVAGTWKRTLKKREVVIELNTFTKLTKAQSRLIGAAAKRYGKFLGLEAVIS